MTGIYYKENSPGYSIDENNMINGTNVRYNFDKIILGSNTKAYDVNATKSDDEDGRNKAIYCYAKSQNKLKLATAGNSIKIDNIVLNIFNPYPETDLPKAWLRSAASQNSTNTRKHATVLYSGGTLHYDCSFSEINNSSVVIKLLCGSRKMLLTGDAEFLVEEILLGIPANQISENTTSRYSGLKIHSSNGGANNDSVTHLDYASLVNDLITVKYGGCSTLEQLESKYKLSRFNKKDLHAQVLKKAHHGVGNTTSIPFLKEVRPNKMVSTGENSDSNYDGSIIKCVNTGPDYCIRSYYNSEESGAEDGPVRLTSSNWYDYVFGTDNISSGNSHGKGSFRIVTETGENWRYKDAYDKGN